MLFDLVLGYGAAEEPAAELLELLAKIDKANAPLLVAHICGTQTDPQQRSRQIDALRAAGVIVADCNAQAAIWASTVAQVQAKKNGATA